MAVAHQLVSGLEVIYEISVRGRQIQYPCAVQSKRVARMKKMRRAISLPQAPSLILLQNRGPCAMGVMEDKS